MSDNCHRDDNSQKVTISLNLKRIKKGPEKGLFSDP